MCGAWAEAPRVLPPPEGVSLRPLDAGDGEALGRLLWLAFAGSVDDGYPSLDEARKDARHALRGGWGALVGPGCLAALCGGELVGATVVAAGAGTPSRPPWLLYLAVQPAHQRRGIATALLSAAIAGLVAAGQPALCLSVTAGNPAVGLYRRFGLSPLE